MKKANREDRKIRNRWRIPFSRRTGLKKGFTLIEVMISLAVGVSLGALTLGLFFQSLDLRKRAADISRASFVAANVMDAVKAKYKPETGEGVLPGFEFYPYKYLIEEIEIDLVKKAQEIMRGGETSKQTGEERSKDLEEMPGTGMIFKMLHYEVTVLYYQKEYKLEFYRGQGVF